MSVIQSDNCLVCKLPLDKHNVHDMKFRVHEQELLKIVDLMKSSMFMFSGMIQ